MGENLGVELSKAFSDLDIKMAETTQNIHVIDSQIGILKRAMHHTNVARQEISILPPETKAYKSVGRMFLLTDLTQVQSNLEEKIVALTTRTNELEAKKKCLEQSLKESEQNLKEMQKQHKEMNENHST
ncbi:prefoldin subunit 1-like [Pararge aegeria]|uniref:Jg25695 protein n=2 Tax=Pararge aegeria TaxID=116150 RepID=A0A8S4QHQ7_9NEOP|nr:prefoldin subunit 1-like [Pararge aegeria]CAH2209588.1 jg25695 [Pararge aegeria aegeria]